MNSDGDPEPEAFDFDSNSFREYFSDVINNVIDDKTFLLEYLSDMRKQHTMDEDIQSSMNSFFDSNPHMFTFMSMCIMNGGEEYLLDFSEEVGKENVEEAINIWNSTEWASECAVAYNLENEGQKYWTSKSLEFVDNQQGETLVEVIMKSGVDTFFEATIPLDVFVEDAVGRVEKTNGSWIAICRQTDFVAVS